eukprot:gnl/MRDRNA2_/MRDRNA2_15055_c0_seq1.p1 gnl/MRDRNA2_/MRDRNA2_15055_c0~~gnl/MRDRNA2_/MRDRNA2_15055_c0_seq1.p1  ORF type:complete len:364 (-),score=60.39 gnl/MRDRNA2_/MRDRNA2_15055_c0_seq1:77-1168(-)
MTEPEFYCLDFGCLPDELYKPNVPLKEWQKHLKTAGKGGFAPNELASIAPISFTSWLERIITYPIYMILNAAPMALPPTIWGIFGWQGALKFVAGFFSLHMLCVVVNPLRDIRKGQYIYTERNIQKYNSIKWVWPKSLQPPNLDSAKIFCCIPHGLAPVGITAYPGWSKVFGERLNHPTAAAVVLKLPIISYFLKKIGYIPAASSPIKKTLEKEESVSLVLDGIAGMFQSDPSTELGWIKQRKGVVKIALTTGAPLVPCYGFGHSKLWRIVMDPLGILEKLSVKLDVSLTPFCGRPYGLLPFGPPYRTPILLAFGEPIIVPKVEKPSQEQIDEYHTKLMDSMMQAFETHKAAYGWPTKSLKFL